MVMDEEEIAADSNTECISDFDDSLTVVNSVSLVHKSIFGVSSRINTGMFFLFVKVKTVFSAFQAGCPPCEAYSLRNITIFLENLHRLLEIMASDNA